MSDAAQDLPLGQRVRLALWFTLAVALFDVVMSVAGLRLGRGPRLSPSAWWLGPVADLAIVGVPAVLVALVVGLFPVRLRTAALITGLAFLPALAVVSYPRKLHLAAAAVLALGLAVVARRILTGPRGTTLTRLMLRTTPMLAGLVLAIVATGAVRSRGAPAEEPEPAAPGTALNVLLLIIDTGRAASFHTWGHDRPNTPVLDSLARHGVRFDHAIAPSSWTLPSHASIFTGRHAQELSASWTAPLDERYPTLAETLAGLGYRTGGFVANVDYGSPAFGLARGFGHYESYPTGAGEAVLSTVLGRELLLSAPARRLSGYEDFPGRKRANVINQRFLDWQARHDAPFFAFLNYFDAHQPLLPPEPWASMFGAPSARRPDLLVRGLRTAWFDPKGALPAAAVTAEQEGYDGGIAYVDHAIGQLLDSLAARGVLARTLVIVTSDHGEQFGEHGWFDHGNTLYEEEVHVPLLLLGPAAVVPAGRVISQTVSLSDLAATAMALAVPGAQAPLPGSSLARHWLDSMPIPAVVSSHLRRPDGTALTAVYAGGAKYIRSPEGEELFRLSDDPGERRNLLPDSSARAMLEALRRRADSLLGSGA